MEKISPNETGRFVVVGATPILCESPLDCKGTATHWNEKERLHLCRACQEILDDAMMGVSRCA